MERDQQFSWAAKPLNSFCTVSFQIPLAFVPVNKLKAASGWRGANAPMNGGLARPIGEVELSSNVVSLLCGVQAVPKSDPKPFCAQSVIVLPPGLVNCSVKAASKIVLIKHDTVTFPTELIP